MGGYTCSFCGKRFNTEPERTGHVKFFHNNVKQVTPRQPSNPKSFY